MKKLLRKTLCITTILLVLLSLPRFQQVFGIGDQVDHDHQGRFKIVRYDGITTAVWYNVTADVLGYYTAGQRYNHTSHSIKCDQGPTVDFRFQILNATYYGLDLQQQIVYRTTFNDSKSDWHGFYSHNASFNSAVYFAYTYIKVKVWDMVEPYKGNATFSLNASVSRRDDVAISNVTASPSEVYPSENVSITVVVENEGAVNETFNVTVYRNDTAIETQTVSNLAPGNGTTLTFNWDTTGVMYGDNEIKAEASVVPGERDADDNTYTDGTVKVLNQPPNNPSKPSGPESGYISIEYAYTTNTTDLNGDNLWYLFDWDDGTNTTVGPHDSGVKANASHVWSYPRTFKVRVKAKDTRDEWSSWSQPLNVTIIERIRYMQNAKWDSTYWKLLWNNTSTYTSQSHTMFGSSISRGCLGVKVYKGTTNISNIIEVGYWRNGQSGLKSVNWTCSEYNVTDTYIKIEIWYKFEGYSWIKMYVDFKTETFTQNTVLNATTWTIYLYGTYVIFNPRGPKPPFNTIAFKWGSSSKESHIQDMIFCYCP